MAISVRASKETNPYRETILSSLLHPIPLFVTAALIRLVLLVYGTWQDSNSAVKYTDIDYLVFTDASRFVAKNQSPYDRDTYRYTPLLAWLLLPCNLFFSYGKVLFALADLLAGWLIVCLLRGRGMRPARAGAFAALWLWNPMVATISTRGSSEGLLALMTMALLWAVERRHVCLSAFLLGLGVHFKIYPFIYAPAIIWWMDEERLGYNVPEKKLGLQQDSSLEARIECVVDFFSLERFLFGFISFFTFMFLNFFMFLACVYSQHKSPDNLVC
jgi:phosphatidylinositol glycan class M